MPEQKFIHFPVDFSKSITEIGKMQTDALSAILHCEVSLLGAIAMKRIAEDALVECYKIACEVEAKIQKN